LRIVIQQKIFLIINVVFVMRVEVEIFVQHA
jgi:hypothetical protein